MTNEPAYYEIMPDFTVEATLINDALAISTEWGENFNQPIHARFMEKYPEMTFDAVDSLQTYVKQTESFIYGLAEKQAEGAISESDIVLLTRLKYPWINSDNIYRLKNIGMYYARR